MEFKHVYNKLRNQGLSAKLIAKRSGIDPTTLSRWANGVSAARFTEVMALCKEFEISIDDLLYADKKLEESMSDKISTDQMVKEIHEIVTSMDFVNSATSDIVNFANDSLKKGKNDQNQKTTK